MLTIRPATREEVIAWHDGLPPMTVRALAAVDEDGKVQGVGGYYLRGNSAIVFTHYLPGMSPRDILRGARAVVELARKTGAQVIGRVEDDAGERSARHFGFEPIGDNLWRLAR